MIVQHEQLIDNQLMEDVTNTFWTTLHLFTTMFIWMWFQ